MLPTYLDLPGCDAAREKLSELIDGELDDTEAARVRLHLAACGACARLAAELVATVRALHAIRRESPAARRPPH